MSLVSISNVLSAAAAAQLAHPPGSGSSKMPAAASRRSTLHSRQPRLLNKHASGGAQLVGVSGAVGKPARARSTAKSVNALWLATARLPAHLRRWPGLAPTAAAIWAAGSGPAARASATRSLDAA